jgi:fructosamine-3-kinase
VTLPGDVAEALSAALGVTVRAGAEAGGGCIHQALRLESADGPLFCKWNRGDAGAAFGVEARGLDALREAAKGSGLRIPAVVSWRDAAAQDPGWLVLEYLPPSAAPPDYDERWGRALAALHAPVPSPWGWHEANRIGSLPQENPDHDRWGDFWTNARLGPQLRRAVDAGLLTTGDRRAMDAAMRAGEALLDDVEGDGPSVVHGDLWAGNVHPGPDGAPVLVDPAVYRGHREVDLAMADLFGGVSARARRSYEGVRPLVPGYSRRRPLYQLYYLLVHLNLFGSGYRGGCLRAAREVAGSLR